MIKYTGTSYAGIYEIGRLNGLVGECRNVVGK